MKIINIFIMPIILFASLSLLSRNLSGTVSAAVFSILLSLVMWKWLPKQVERQVKRMYREGKNRTFLGEQQLELDENHIIDQGKYSESKYSWDTVERIIFTDDYAFIYVSSVNAIVIPNRKITEGNYDELKEFLNETFKRKRGTERNNNAAESEQVITIPIQALKPDNRIGKNSELGIVSFILSIVLFTALFCTFLILFLFHGEYETSQEQHFPVAGTIFMTMILSSFAGTGLGIAGVCQKNRKKIFAVVGLILNAAALLFLGILILIGIFIS